MTFSCGLDSAPHQTLIAAIPCTQLDFNYFYKFSYACISHLQKNKRKKVVEQNNIKSL